MYVRIRITYKRKIITVIRNEPHSTKTFGAKGLKGLLMKFNPRCSTVSTLVSAAMRRSPCFVPLLKNSSSLRIRDAAGEHLISLFSPCERTGTALLLSLLTRIIPVEAFLRSWNIPCSFRLLVRSMARACTAASLSFYLCNERSWAVPPVLLHLRLFLLVILSRKKKKEKHRR